MASKKRRYTLKMGRPDTRLDAPSHVTGVHQGNAPGNYRKMSGHLPDGRSTASRSTGINPGAHDAILPEMPNISPP